MSYFKFVQFFGKALKTLKIIVAIKRVLDCFFLLDTLTENTNKYLPTRETAMDFRIVSFCDYNWKDKQFVELIFAIVGRIQKNVAFHEKLPKNLCLYSNFHIVI